MIRLVQAPGSWVVHGDPAFARTLCGRMADSWIVLDQSGSESSITCVQCRRVLADRTEEGAE